MPSVARDRLGHDKEEGRGSLLGGPRVADGEKGRELARATKQAGLLSGHVHVETRRKAPSWAKTENRIDSFSMFFFHFNFQSLFKLFLKFCFGFKQKHSALKEKKYAPDNPDATPDNKTALIYWVNYCSFVRVWCYVWW